MTSSLTNLIFVDVVVIKLGTITVVGRTRVNTETEVMSSAVVIVLVLGFAAFVTVFTDVTTEITSIVLGLIFVEIAVIVAIEVIIDVVVTTLVVVKS